MTMADRIVVMKEGRILQVGAPMEVYERPADVFTARFIGSPTMNVLSGHMAAGVLDLGLGGPIHLPRVKQAAPGEILVGVRPQDLTVLDSGAVSPDLVLQGIVSVVEPLGSEAFVHVEAGDRLILASASAKSPPPVGTPVRLGARAENLHFFDPASERALSSDSER
jgi:multiple sugar transport system ATP-binding protein